MVDSRTTLYGLIGLPIKHSLSPQIHNYIFKHSKINSIYLCFEVNKSHLKEAIKGAISLGLSGLNVTIPYKEKVIPYLDSIDKEASIIGAVNTIKIWRGKTYGFNTDGIGFISSLKKHNFICRNKNIFILGAGGAAKAVSVYLAKAKVNKIIYYDIIYDKAQELALHIRKFFPSLETNVIREKDKISLKNVDLLVNATGVGLHKKDPLVIELKDFEKNLVVYDLIYNPLSTPLIKGARKKGLRTINGLWMLIYQAIKAEEIWHNKKIGINENIIYNLLVKEIKNG
ncbi:MAG: shikimate dehydrogenase [Candidatus Omnitrophica bacterium]|nr:shikimate dehydrogenase [Candidatus Omnitrophota bacterium]